MSEITEILEKLVELDRYRSMLTERLENTEEEIKTLMDTNHELLLHGTKKTTNLLTHEGLELEIEIKAIDRKDYFDEVQFEINKEKKRYEESIADMKEYHKAINTKIKVGAQNAGQFTTNRKYYLKVKERGQ